MPGLRVHFVMPPELVAAVDEVAVEEGLSRGAFVRRALESALSDSGSPSRPIVADSVPAASSRASVSSEASLGSVDDRREWKGSAASRRARPPVPEVPGVVTGRELLAARQAELNKARERKR